MHLTTSSQYPRFSRSQYVWALFGLAVLVFTAVVAADNFEAIYAAQKDFVVGSLLSLTGFCFGRALSRTQEQRAIELIRTAPTKAVEIALTAERIERLHRDGVFQRLSLLARNLEAAAERIAEYYDTEARRLDFYRYLPLLRVVLSDLDQARANIVGIERVLGPEGSIQPVAGSPEERGGYAIPAVARLALASIQRDLRESLGRRDQAYEWLAAHSDRPVNQELWDVFSTMTSDALKADRLLDALLGQYVAFPPAEVLVTAIGYLAAAIMRADEVVTILVMQGIEEPKIFDVMKQDLCRAKGALGLVDLQEVRSVRAPALLKRPSPLPCAFFDSALSYAAVSGITQGAVIDNLDLGGLMAINPAGAPPERRYQHKVCARAAPGRADDGSCHWARPAGMRVQYREIAAHYPPRP